jgi:hypothetical protein
MKYTVNSEVARGLLIRDIALAPIPFSADIKTGDRSLDQNALSHVWYGQVSKQGRDMSTAQVRRWCKLHLGVPIMRAHEESFRQAWDSMIKERMFYWEKLALMDWWPVTSIMTREQMSEYLDAMQQHFAEAGIVLTGRDVGMGQYPEAR